jgi:hypothetical protein
LTEHKACHVEGSGSHVGIRGAGYRLRKSDKYRVFRTI